MEKRQYRDTKEYVSLLGFGAMRLPHKADGSLDYDLSQVMVDYAISHGVNYFDTAYVYMGGNSERFLGNSLKKYPRESYNIATKMPIHIVKKRENIKEIFETSLSRLKTDYIDYYLLHAVKSSNWNHAVTMGIYDVLKEYQKQGRIRYIGFSFHDTPALLSEIVNTYDWDFAQIQLNYMDWTLQNAQEQYRILKEKSLPIMVMEPVRGGALAVLCDEAVAILKGANPGASTASWAIRYVASFPEVICVLSGMSNMEQVIDNVNTMENFKPIDEIGGGGVNNA
jgi:predicted aldo/keto reductase-like oxidoreductase